MQILFVVNINYVLFCASFMSGFFKELFIFKIKKKLLEVSRFSDFFKCLFMNFIATRVIIHCRFVDFTTKNFREKKNWVKLINICIVCCTCALI